MIVNVPLERIMANPWQTRLKEPGGEYIKELALDIARNGLLQTPVGRPTPSPSLKGGEKEVELAFGHNRLAAFRWLYDLRNNSDIPGDWSRMPVDVRELTDEEMANLAWSENEKRRDVTPIERARAIERRLKDFGWTNRQAAEALGIDHSTISNIMRLLRLPEKIQAAVEEGTISERAAVALLPMYDAPVKVFANNYYSRTPEQIEWNALKGASSEYIRSEVDQLLKASSEDLSRAPFKLDQLFPEEGRIYCGLCSTCDKRMGSRNLCFDRICYQAKKAWLERKYLEKVSQATGWGLLDEQKGGVPSDLPYFESELEKILATKCENIRLVYQENAGSDPRVVKGHPKAFLVCEKRNGSCTCVKGLREWKGMEKKDEEKQIQEVEEGPVLGDDPAVDMGDPEGAGVAVEKGPSSGELEEVARQARRAKMELAKALPEIQKKLTEHLYKCLSQYEQVGVIQVALNGSTWFGRKEIDSDAVYRDVASKASRYFISDCESIDELVKWINAGLERMNIEDFSLDGRAADPVDVEIVTL